jgi:hypothetical protein
MLDDWVTSCAISARVLCIVAQHRLAFERLHSYMGKRMHGTASLGHMLVMW